MNRITLYLLPFAGSLFAQTYTINAFAGNGAAGMSGDGGSAVEAQLNIPMGIAFATNGSLYIADQLNWRIRRVTPEGTISTVAGRDSSGFSGDGAAATSAQLANPCGVAVDSAGNFYIADTRNHRIRRVTSGGTISTVAGTGEAGFSGDGGAATSALLNGPIAVALDAAGTLYIADNSNSIVRKVDSSGTITAVAGVGVAGYSGDGGPATSAALNHPTSLAFGHDRNLYISDSFNHVIRKVTPDGIITTVAGSGVRGFYGDGGAAVAASLDYPEGLAVDAFGNIYVADSVNNRVRKVSLDGIITTIAGTGAFGQFGDGGSALRAHFQFPNGLAIDPSGNIYVADNQNSRIRRLTPSADSAPQISSSGVRTAEAFGGFRSIAPGTWIEIFGSNLASKSGPTKVSIAGREASLSYVSSGQVNAQVPVGVGLGMQDVIVTTSAGSSTRYKIDVKQSQPGLLAPLSFQLGDKRYVSALLSDGSSFALPSGAVVDVASRPARPGEIVTLFGAGFGTVEQPLEIKFGDSLASIQSAIDENGIYRVNAVVPQLADSEAVALTFSVGGVAAEQTLYVAVATAEP